MLGPIGQLRVISFECDTNYVGQYPTSSLQILPNLEVSVLTTSSIEISFKWDVKVFGPNVGESLATMQATQTVTYIREDDDRTGIDNLLKLIVTHFNYHFQEQAAKRDSVLQLLSPIQEVSEEVKNEILSELK